MTKVQGPAPQATGPLSPIQVIPTGLLGLLQLKQLGRLPDKLSDLVAPVLELRDWYLTARRLDTLGLFASVPLRAIAGGLQGNFAFQVGGLNVGPPANQIWYVEQYSVDCVNTGAMVATDVIRYCGTLIAPTGATYSQVTNDVSDYVAAARTRVIDTHADRGFWAFPGDFFGFRVFDNLSTNGWTFSLNLRATPCPV